MGWKSGDIITVGIAAPLSAFVFHEFAENVARGHENEAAFVAFLAALVFCHIIFTITPDRRIKL